MISTPTGRLVASVASVVLSGLILVGCAPEPEPTPTPTAESTSAPAPTEPPVELQPDGTAEDNLPYFASIVDEVWNGPDAEAGRAYVDALTAAGFDRAAMQVTEDQSTVGNAAESMQFSVRWGDDCLIGQVGQATGDPVATVLPGLAGGGCLIGQTRSIDW